MYVLSSTAFGASRERAVYDLQYVPEKRVAYGFSELSYENYLILTSDTDIRIEESRFTQAIGYGFTDDFTMTLAANYLHGRTGFDFEDSIKDHQSNEGLSDPTISAKYRLQDNYFRFDALMGLLVSSGDREQSGDEVNNKVGGHRLNLGFNFGQKFELVQWSVLMAYYRQFESTSEFSSGSFSQTTKRDPFNYYGLDISGLIFIDDKVILKGFINSILSDPTGRAVRSTVGQVILGPELQFLLTENFLLRTGVAYKTFQVTSRDGYNQGFLYTLGANYQF